MQTAYALLDKIKDQIETNCLVVEIGSARDGGSTYYLKNLANQSGSDFVTVDPDPIYLGASIKTATMRGEDWVKTELPKTDRKIGVAFIDGFDWIDQPNLVRTGNALPDIVNLIAEYKKKGMTLNNINSAVVHTKQILGMLPYMHSKCVVLFNNTRFDNQNDAFIGKGAGAVYALLAEGFQILSTSYKSNYVMVGRNIRSVNLMNLNLDTLSEKYMGPPKRQNTIIYNDIE
jgi:hypothetical protein